MPAKPSDPLPKSIVVIGGGVSGTLVCVHLLRLARAGTQITLIERAPPIGRGVAYGTTNPEHLLNVPAARMSVWPDDPEHFLRWVAERSGRLGYPDAVSGSDFLPRAIYGDYVASVFAEARQNTAENVKLEVVAGEATDIDERSDGSLRVYLQDGRSYLANRVVLALGNLPGEYPIKKPLRVYHTRRYVHTAWQPELLEGIRRKDDVLVVGQGLTASDLILQLDRMGHQGHIHALSRRGLRPLMHELGQTWPAFFAGKPLPRTMRELVRRVRDEVRTAAQQGVGWRAVVDSIRPQAAEIWQVLSWEERARFMRHVRPFWEVHRHRIPAATAQVIERLVTERRLTFYAGRLTDLQDAPDGAHATIGLRGQKEIRLVVAKVINCTGPRTDYSKYQHPLLINLLARGLIDHDPLALGIHASAAGEVFRYRGAPSGKLFTLGAPLKGTLWECTAVPEIRVQARSLAHLLLSH